MFENAIAYFREMIHPRPIPQLESANARGKLGRAHELPSETLAIEYLSIEAILEKLVHERPGRLRLYLDRPCAFPLLGRGQHVQVRQRQSSTLKPVRADSIRALRRRGKQRRTFGDVTPEELSAVRPQLDAPGSRHGNRTTVTAIDDQEIVGQYSTARLKERSQEG